MNQLEEIEKLILEKLNKMIFTRTTDDDFAVGFRAGLHHAMKIVEGLKADLSSKKENP